MKYLIIRYYNGYASIAAQTDSPSAALALINAWARNDPNAQYRLYEVAL